MDLAARGWKRIELDRTARVEVWRLGWEPFCVELEVWKNKKIVGRLCAPGIKVFGNIVFESLGELDVAVPFLERLLVGANNAVPDGVSLK